MLDFRLADKTTVKINVGERSSFPVDDFLNSSTDIRKIGLHIYWYLTSSVLIVDMIFAWKFLMKWRWWKLPLYFKPGRIHSATTTTHVKQHFSQIWTQNTHTAVMQVTDFQTSTRLEDVRSCHILLISPAHDVVPCLDRGEK